MNPSPAAPARAVAPVRVRVRPTRRRRPTGGIYIAVMAAVLVVTLIGMSSVLASRIDRRGSTAGDDAVRARFYARSFAEIVLQRLQNDGSWRSKYANNVWQAQETVDDAKVQFKLVDEADADLTDDSSEPFRVQTQATCGTATRSISMSVQPPTSGSGGSPPSKVDNGGMELFTSATQPPTRWYHYPSGSVDTVTASSPAGARHARCYGRTVGSGLAQDLAVSSLKNGGTYDVHAYVKPAAGLTVRVGLLVTDSTGATNRFQVSRVALSGTWNNVTGTVTPTWSGALTSARLLVDSAGTAELRVDDVTMSEQRPATATLSVVSGTVRRDLAE